MALVLFSYFAGAIILTAILVVALRNPVYSVLSLLVLFFHVAGIYVLLDAEFIAAIQIIVYAGAILVLYLFVVMLLSLKEEERYHRQLGVGMFLGLLLLAELIYILGHSGFLGPRGWYSQIPLAQAGNTEVLGRALFTTYLFPFEVASLILLVAMIGAVVLVKKSILEK